MQHSEHKHRHEPGEGYWDRRTHFIYYRYVDLMVRGLAADANSLVDVGSADARYVEGFDWIPHRHALDITAPYSSENVRGIEADFFDFEPEEKYDFATCLQVLEHIPDAEAFAQKLFQTAHRVLISVPYLWEEGSTDGHLHDPVDQDKLASWTGREPDYHIVVREPFRKKRRLISYYHTEGERLSLRAARQNVMAAQAGEPARDSDALAEELERQSQRNRVLKEQCEALQKRCEEAAQDRDRLRQLYNAVTQSTSWKYTGPARRLIGTLKSLSHRDPKA